MSQADEANATVEAVATAMAPAPNTCLLPDCGLVVPPARRGGVRKFCSDRHRAAYRDLMIQLAVREAMAIVQEAQDEMDRLSARMEGALAQLRKLQHHGKRQRRTGKDLTGPRARA